jgi:exodeoxyribonuclease-3
MLQELKGTDFPQEIFAGLGYQAHYVGQKAYNGVATLTRQPAELVDRHVLPDDDQARFLHVVCGGVHLVNIYAPNGNPMDSDKFPYKLRFLDALLERMQHWRAIRQTTLIAGDYNIIPAEIDAANIDDWRHDALFAKASRDRFRHMLHLGYTDILRVQHQGPGIYTFWDYQAGAWPRDLGIRIDHLLATPDLTDRLVAAGVDRSPRALDKPSDHTPVFARFDLPV